MAPISLRENRHMRVFVAVLGGIHNLFLLPLAQNSAAGSVCVPDGREQVWSQHVGGKRGASGLCPYRCSC